MEKFSILAITETWLGNSYPDSLLHIEGYQLFRKDREDRGGGVALYVSNTAKCKVLNIDSEGHGIESLWCELTFNCIKWGIL